MEYTGFEDFTEDYFISKNVNTEGWVIVLVHGIMLINDDSKVHYIGK